MNLSNKTVLFSIISSVVLFICLSFFYYTATLRKDISGKLEALDICLKKVQQEKQTVELVTNLKEEIKKEGLSIESQKPIEISAEFTGKNISTIINYINNTYYSGGLFFVERFAIDVDVKEGGVQYAIKGKKF